MGNNHGLKFEGGYPLAKEIIGFVDYLISFYGDEDAVYPMGMTRETALNCALEYLGGNYPCIEENQIINEFGVKVPTHLWGGGDTIDREKVCEIFLSKGDV